MRGVPFLLSFTLPNGRFRAGRFDRLFTKCWQRIDENEIFCYNKKDGEAVTNDIHFLSILAV